MDFSFLVLQQHFQLRAITLHHPNLSLFCCEDVLQPAALLKILHNLFVLLPSWQAELKACFCKRGFECAGKCHAGVPPWVALSCAWCSALLCSWLVVMNWVSCFLSNLTARPTNLPCTVNHIFLEWFGGCYCCQVFLLPFFKIDFTTYWTFFF